MMPALFTRMWMAPWRSTVAATAAFTEAVSERSAAITSALPPAAVMASATSCSLPRVRAAHTTVAPCAPSSFAMASPMP